MNIFIFGDSNTWGYIPNVDGYRKDAPIFQYLNSQVWWAELMKEHNVKVNGLCGRAIACDNPWLKGRNALSTFDVHFAGAQDVDLVIFQLGTNDCKTLYNLSANNIAQNLEILTEKAKALTGAEIMIISPSRLVMGNKVTDKYYVGGEEKTYLLDGEYKSLAIKNGYTFVSGFDIEVGEDGEHLTAKGHKLLGKRVSKALENFLEKE